MIYNATLIKLTGGLYQAVTNSGETFKCRARGNFRVKNQSPLVGDKVKIRIENPDDEGLILEIYERKNHLIRPAIANLDNLIIVSALSIPKPNLSVVDRLIAAARFNNITPIIIFNKADEEKGKSFAKIYKQIGYDTVVTSAETNRGVKKLRKLIKGKISAMAGNTGVGKSALLNAINKEFNLACGEISQKLNRGRHTTRHVELLKIDNNTFIADTPGFSSFDLQTCEVTAQGLAYCFDDFLEFAEMCKFASCSHISEDDCEVLKAVSAGKIALSRYKSYKYMFDTIKDIKHWEKTPK